MANILTTSWDESDPANSKAPSNGADDMRTIKESVRELVNVDHDFPSSGNGEDLGQHTALHLQGQADLGTGGATAPLTPLLGAETQSNNGTDKPELTYTDEDDEDIQLTKDGAIALPAGVMQMFAGGGASAPTGWLICDGSAYSRTDYVDLYNAIGTAFGDGDGSTSFNVPDMRGKSPVGTNDADVPNGADSSYTTRNEGDTGGEEEHTLTVTEIASHSHSGTIKDSYLYWKEASGGDGNIYAHKAYNPAETENTGSTGGGGAHENMHPFATVNFIIKT